MESNSIYKCPRCGLRGALAEAFSGYCLSCYAFLRHGLKRSERGRPKTREAMKTTKKDLMVLCLIIISVIFLFLICARHEKTREDLLREQQMEQESEWKVIE